MNIISLFSKINTWHDFNETLRPFNKKQKGDAFELLSKVYFLIDHKYNNYDNIWLLSEIPKKDLEIIGLESRDLGIDLIAKKGSEYHAIQCKYHTDKNQNVTFKEVSTFISLLGGYDKLTEGYICSSAASTSKNYDDIKKKHISKLLADTWNKLDKDFFDRVRKYLNKEQYNPIPFYPRPHQKNAINNAYNHFIKNKESRGKLIFPCGAGKSLTGFWMIEKLGSMSTVIAVPSLSLIKQTLDVYLKEIVAREIKVNWLCICSDEEIGDNSEIRFKTDDIGVPCNTDPKYIKYWLIENKHTRNIIFTTYQSSRLIANISKELKHIFDLGILDEAHKTVGDSDRLFSHLLFEENISIKSRIFMTATERFYSGSKDNITSMDDSDVYGNTFAQMSFKEAIDLELLTDYKIITIAIKKSEISELIKNNGLVKLNNVWKKETEARSLASMLALRKAMKQFTIKHAVSFHSSIVKAQRNKELQTHITNNYGYDPIDSYTVSGKDKTSKRNDIIQEFASSKKALITNAKCLTEGIDIPNIDCIVFADPRKSKVDIVQALGRALRKKKDKEWGYVILPVIYDGDTNEIDNYNFNEILSIVRGLAANDERIIEFFKDKSLDKKGKEGEGLEVFSMICGTLSESDFAEQFNIKIWEKLSKFNWMPFEEARDFARSLKLRVREDWLKSYDDGKILKNISKYPENIYKKKWINWYDWLGREDRDPENISEQGLEEIKIFIKNNGHSYIHDDFETEEGFALGRFCKMIRHNKAYQHLKFELNRIEGWALDIEEDKFLKCLHELKKVKKSKSGRITIPRDHYFFIGKLKYSLGGFVMKARKAYQDVNKNEFKKTKHKSLFDDKNDPRIKMLENLDGWVWTQRSIPDYEKAKSIARKMKVKNYLHYCEILRKDNPHNLPFKPYKKYKKHWKNFYDFFGIQGISNVEKSKNKFSYNEAKEYINNNCQGKIKTIGQFNLWKQGAVKGIPKFPEKMPKSPQTSYRKDWISIYDFFNKNYVSRVKNEYPHHKFKRIDYLTLKEFCQKKNFTSGHECSNWLRLNKEYFHKMNLYAPVKGGQAYEEFQGWDEFLGKIEF